MVAALAWLLVLVCVVVPAAGCGGTGDDGRASDPFAYDRGESLGVREVGSWRDEGVTVHDVSYASPRGGRVPAFVVVPDGDGPFAGLILQHGMPSSRRDMLPIALEFARLGAVGVAIDAPFARRSGNPVRFDERDRAEQIQLVVDLRRAVDLLRARSDVDGARLAYLGVSYGAAMGGLLAGVEHRIAAFVLAVGDGGLVEHFGARHDAGGSLPPFPADRRRRWLDAMQPIEPLRLITRASAPLLMQSGRQDDLVPPPDARRYQRAAPEPKQIKWYDAGHQLPPQATCDQARWLSVHVGIAPARSVRRGSDDYRCHRP
jgi:dienelactone hydrolase